MARRNSSPVPKVLTPMAAQPVESLPEGQEWLYELKLDGYRALMINDGERVRILSRNQKDLTRQYPTIAAAGQRLKAEQAVVDGEIVAVDDSGRPSFQALQHRSLHPQHQILFCAFDVLNVNGRDLTREPLTQRRRVLAGIIPAEGPIRLLRDLPGTAAEVVQAVRAMGLEGVIAKRRDSVYREGERSEDWGKLKLERSQEFVVGGYRLASPSSIDALLVGYYEGRALLFAGKVRGDSASAAGVADPVEAVQDRAMSVLKPAGRASLSLGRRGARGGDES